MELRNPVLKHYSTFDATPCKHIIQKKTSSIEKPFLWTSSTLQESLCWKCHTFALCILDAVLNYDDTFANLLLRPLAWFPSLNTFCVCQSQQIKAESKRTLWEVEWNEVRNYMHNASNDATLGMQEEVMKSFWKKNIDGMRPWLHTPMETFINFMFWRKFNTWKSLASRNVVDLNKNKDCSIRRLSRQMTHKERVNLWGKYQSQESSTQEKLNA